MPGLSKIENPHDAVIAVGKQNTELVEEVTRLYAEVDRYVRALQLIATVPPDRAAVVASNALANRPLTT